MKHRTAILLPLVLVCAFALLTGCALDDWKDDYRGTNLIANRGFTIASFTDAYAGGASPAFDYVNFEEVSAAEYGVTTGLPDNPGPVYRLELVNLLPNGDFEETAAAATPAGWTVDAGSSIVGDATDGLAITGVSAFYDVSGNQAAYFDLRGGLLDGLVYPGTYHMELLLRRATTETRTNFDYGNVSISYLALDNISWQTDASADNPDLNVETFPNDSNMDVVNLFSVADGAAHYLYLGAPDDASAVVSQRARIDNVRIGRFDINPHVALPLGPVTVDGALNILRARYRFSIYVKSEIDSQVTPSTPNAFRPEQITLGINDDQYTVTAAVGGWTTSEWVQISVETALDPEDLTAANPLTPWMTVTATDSPTVGRILVAAPVLELATD